MVTAYDTDKLHEENNILRVHNETLKAQVCDLQVDHSRLKPLVDQYFIEHKLVEPNAEQAFLFLVSEMGELAEAFIDTLDNPQIIETLYIALQLSGLGKSADHAVSHSGKEWHRNHDRYKVSKPGQSLRDEIADVLMMTDRLAATIGADATLCLIEKMVRKEPSMRKFIHAEHD